MVWISLILAIIQFAMKLPEIIDAVTRLIEIIRGRPFWSRSSMAKEALAAINQSVENATKLHAFDAKTAVHAATPVANLLSKWEAKYGKVS